MDQPQQPQSRELMYCHQCENEWYRDEHGIVCPECQSDFTEIIEADHDPRANDDAPGAGDDFYAPDPDEGDIDDLHWTQNGPGQPPGGHFRGTFTRNITTGGQDAGGQPGLLGGLIGNVMQGLLGSPQQQRGAQPGMPGAQGEGNRSAPGSPQQGQHEQQRGNNGTFIRHGHGPGFSYTITTSAGGNLFPRDANQPQPFQGQPDHIENMMRQMFMNIGAVPGHGFGGGGGMGMHAHGPDGPIFMGVGGPGMRGNAGPMPLNDIFSLFGMPRGGVQGDAVYSQEALDRIITQLMEQHQAGNAPGPASAEAIESLPKRKITEKDAGDSGTADCSICMDEAKVGDEVTELPCSHWFHHDCIRAWLAEHDTCPHCRQGIMPKEEANANRSRQPDQQPLNNMHSPEYQNPQVPGGYPFPRANSSGGEGSRQNPWTVPDDSSRSNNGGSSGGMFSRMREAFSPGGRSRSSGQDPNNRGGDPGSSGMNDGQ